MNRSTGTDGTQSATLRDEVPWSDSIRGYDRQHRTIYLRILDACADNASVEEMAELILGIDPALEPIRLIPAIHQRVTTRDGAAGAIAQMTARTPQIGLDEPFVDQRLNNLVVDASDPSRARRTNCNRVANF